MFSVGCWYSTTNDTFIWIVRRSVFCGSIMPIYLTLIILLRFLLWSLLLSTIIVGGTCCFSILPTALLIIFRSVWLMLYKHTKNVYNKNIVRYKLNAWNIFDLMYYWPSCVKTMYLPIGEENLFKYGLVPILLISSSSTGDILPEWLLIM